TLGVDLTVVLVLLLDRGEVSDRGVQPVLVEPVHPGEGGELEFVDCAERAVDLDALGLVEPHDGLGEGVVVAVADGSDRGDGADVREALGVAQRGVLLRFNRWSECWMTPVTSSPARSRIHSAISSASSGRSVGIRSMLRHPTIRRE